MSVGIKRDLKSGVKFILTNELWQQGKIEYLYFSKNSGFEPKLRTHYLFSPISKIERKYCLISASYLAGLFEIFILLHIWQNCVCFGDFSPMTTLCDAYHKEFESR